MRGVRGASISRQAYGSQVSQVGPSGSPPPPGSQPHASFPAGPCGVAQRGGQADRRAAIGALERRRFGPNGTRHDGNVVWGVLFKDPSLPGGLLALAATLALIATAKADEAECTRFFGPAYRDYMQRTRMFVPFLF